jgi:K+-transporting ATPase ATPase C chain
MFASLRPAAVLLLVFSVVCGLAYPAVVTGIAQLVMPAKANGSLVVDARGVVVGSELIGQSFTNPGRFWGRPSATSPQPNNAMSSSGSNLGPTNPALLDGVKGHVAAFNDADRAAGVDARAHGDAKIPVDLVTASGSGLDPDITPAGAYWQVPRIAHVRGVDEGKVNAIVDEHVVGRTLGMFGEPRVNVLALNLALDQAFGPLAAANVDGAKVDGAPH